MGWEISRETEETQVSKTTVNLLKLWLNNLLNWWQNASSWTWPEQSTQPQFRFQEQVYHWEKWKRTVRLSTRNNYCVRQGYLNQERRKVGTRSRKWRCDMIVNSLKGSMVELEKIGWDTKRWWWGNKMLTTKALREMLLLTMINSRI